MPDWKKQVRGRMAGLNLPRELKDEIIAELAAHLEDSELMPGSDDAGSVHRGFESIPWRKLTRAIRNAKSQEAMMNHRTRVFWLPAMANLTLYTIVLWIGALYFDDEVWTPRLSPASHRTLPIFHPWLFVLPACGALGALLARRASAAPGARLIASLAPSLVWLSVFSIMELVFVCAPEYFRGFPLHQLALAAFGWIVLPAVALALGAVPFLGSRQTRSDS